MTGSPADLVTEALQVFRQGRNPQQFDRPPREAYVRACVIRHGVECHVGLEMRDGDDVDTCARVLQDIVRIVLNKLESKHDDIAKAVEEGIRETWPERVYFIETDEHGRGVQIFQPWGVPRNR